MPTVGKPILAAYWKPRWPSPPRPSTATTSPGCAPLLRRALNVVRPAHISGAGSAGGSSARIRASAPAGAVMVSPYPAALCSAGGWRGPHAESPPRWPSGPAPADQPVVVAASRVLRGREPIRPLPAVALPSVAGALPTVAKAVPKQSHLGRWVAR